MAAKHKMKANLFFFFLLLPLTTLASSLSELRDLYDTTFSRDNSYCKFDGVSFELQIRSTDRYAQPDDRDYGEYPFLIQNNTHYKIDLNQNIGRYRFIYAKEDHCTKTLSLPLNKNEITLFLAHDSRPYPDKLVLIHYNPKLKKAHIVHTNEPIKEYFQVGNKLYFSSYYSETSMSIIDFDGTQYNYLRNNLPIWKVYENNQFTTTNSVTFEQFEWKNYFRDFNEFNDHFQWDRESKTFKKDSFEIIFNTQLKKRCLRVSQEWRCRSY